MSFVHGWNRIFERISYFKCQQLTVIMCVRVEEKKTIPYTVSQLTAIYYYLFNIIFAFALDFITSFTRFFLYEVIFLVFLIGVNEFYGS